MTARRRDQRAGPNAPPRSLADIFALRRRYTRSVNLERDLVVLESIDGYVPTPRALEALRRITTAQAEPQTSRAWTLTGVYGTGKSAFAHFAAALYGAADDPMRRRALAILRSEPGATDLVRHFKQFSPTNGFIRAIATGRREPIAATVIRALSRGADSFWAGRQGRRPAVLEQLRQARAGLEETGRKARNPDFADVAELVHAVAHAGQTGLILIIDELGKALEYAAQTGGASDLYLLQQLAELPARSGEPPVLVLGLLHQAHSEYGQGLTTAQRGEWEKIQGRFEDVPFAESGDQMLRLVAQVLEPGDNNPLAPSVESAAGHWADYLRREQHSYIADTLPAARIAALYPLHPVAALVLPPLCAKYAQNDRSLFTFLTSNEPNSLARFLAETSAPKLGQLSENALPMLKLQRVYDYFVDAVGTGLVTRPQFQRWAEVHSVIRDAAGLSDDELVALKVIGTLNLVTSSGPLRANRALCVAALVNRPMDAGEAQRWLAVLDQLQSRGLVTYRQQVDEYRVWEGSDFDVEAAVRAHIAVERRPLADVLTTVAPLPPVVAQRHSYRTGTLRYFERHFIAGPGALSRLAPASYASDGVIAYWISEQPPESVPAAVEDGRPLVVIPAPRGLGPLRAAALEYAALATLDRSSLALQADGVARREVRQRLALARRVLDDALHAAFDIGDGRDFWAGGERWAGGTLGAVLSELCERAYPRSPVLWNELINRRELTSQGARARRELIEAILGKATKARFGLIGDGPEVSMYASVFLKTGIHSKDCSTESPLFSETEGEPRWIITPPTDNDDTRIREVWDAIEAFCLATTTEPRGVDQLYSLLEAPPYGVKRGIIPVLLAAVLVHHADDVSVYRDGTFLPTMGGEHFELLVKNPSRFTIKHFALAGIRLELFRELESVLRRPGARYAPEMRNTTLLGVVRPLVRFATSLRVITRKTKRVSAEAQAVRDALLSSTEPDVLLFERLPLACGFQPFAPPSTDREADRTHSSDAASAQYAEAFRHALFRALRELEGHYDQALDRCRTQIHSTFGIRSDLLHLREDLRVRAQYLVGRVIDHRLKGFVLAAANADSDDREWLESLVMIVADRPLETWLDDNTLTFEVHLSDVARRFANIEALQKESAREGREGFDARRITVTNPDGEEVHRLVWIGRDERGFVEEKVRELLGVVRSLPGEHQRQAIAMALVEELLAYEKAVPDVGLSARGALGRGKPVSDVALREHAKKASG